MESRSKKQAVSWHSPKEREAPSEKYMDSPPKMKYFQEGMASTMTAEWFHLGFSVKISGSDHSWVARSKQIVVLYVASAFHPP